MVIFPRVGFRPTLLCCLAPAQPHSLAPKSWRWASQEKHRSATDVAGRALAAAAGGTAGHPSLRIAPLGVMIFFHLFLCQVRVRQKSPLFAGFRSRFFRLLVRGEAPPAARQAKIPRLTPLEQRKSCVAQFSRLPSLFCFPTQPNSVSRVVPDEARVARQLAPSLCS